MRLLIAPVDLVLLETLLAKYCDDGHLPSAHIYRMTKPLASRRHLVPQRDADIVVYCASNTCQNSHIAANFLAQAVYSNVAVYAGEKQDWIDAGLTLVTKEAIT